jgi:hypothetical protein
MLPPLWVVQPLCATVPDSHIPYHGEFAMSTFSDIELDFKLGLSRSLRVLPQAPVLERNSCPVLRFPFSDSGGEHERGGENHELDMFGLESTWDDRKRGPGDRDLTSACMHACNTFGGFRAPARAPAVQ